MRREIANSLAETYRRLTLLSAALMLLGWLWHLWRHDTQNSVIALGIGTLLVTPLFTLFHLAYLTRHTDRQVARYSIIVIALVGLALLTGLLMGGIQ
ncbi:hypothetical protein HRbin15_01204 [bacterium HR15]|nr:hypothetical protein HRbin15_01204 [bacterium HR15]